MCYSVQFSSSLRPFGIPWIAAYQASLSITNSWSLLKLMSIQSVTPSNHLEKWMEKECVCIYIYNQNTLLYT